MTQIVLKQNDTRPVLTDTLTYSDGSIPTLTGATLNWIMKLRTPPFTIINQTATITSPSTGAVTYTFTTSDTKVPGTYDGLWRVTFADASTMSFPSDGYIEVVVQPSLT